MAVAGAAGTPPEEPWVPLLRELAQVRDHLERVEFQIVALVRSYGATWRQIGDELGISQQAARQRFMVPRKRRR